MSNAADVRTMTPIPISLDKERTLKYDLNAFIALEEEFGDIDKTLKQFEKGSMKALRALLWAGLIHEDESLTPKKVGSIVKMSDIEVVSDAMMKAIEQDMPATEASKGNPQPPATGE